jgi:hypothetical protein
MLKHSNSDLCDLNRGFMGKHFRFELALHVLFLFLFHAIWSQQVDLYTGC